MKRPTSWTALSGWWASSLLLSGVSPSLLFTVHFTTISERAQLCWDGHWRGCSVTASSSGTSESSWASPIVFKHSLNCFPEAHSFTFLWHGKGAEGMVMIWNDRYAGWNELICKGGGEWGDEVYKWRTKRLRARGLSRGLFGAWWGYPWQGVDWSWKNGLGTTFSLMWLAGFTFILPVRRSWTSKSDTSAFLSLLITCAHQTFCFPGKKLPCSFSGWITKLLSLGNPQDML